MKGGDEARFSLLMGPVGAKMVSRIPASQTLGLMQAILAARGVTVTEDAAAVQAPLQLKEEQVTDFPKSQCVCALGE